MITNRKTFESSAASPVRMTLSIAAKLISLFLREKVGFYSMTFSKVSDMIAMSMLRNVIWEMITVRMNRK